MRYMQEKDPVLDFRMSELTVSKMRDEIELDAISGVVALVNAEVAAARIVVQQNDAREATLVIKRNV